MTDTPLPKIQLNEVVKKFNNPNSNTIICKERVNGRRLKHIIDNFNEMPFINDIDEPERILTMIEKYFSKIKDGHVKTSYTQLYNYGGLISLDIHWLHNLNISSTWRKFAFQDMMIFVSPAN